MLYRNRYYSTGLGRFVSRDPIGYRAKDVNLVRFVSKAPIGLNDVYGLEPSPEQKDECCEDTKANCPRAKGVAICCKGAAVACNYFTDVLEIVQKAHDEMEEKMGHTNPAMQGALTAAEIENRCVDVHENVHLTDMDCTGKEDGASSESLRGYNPDDVDASEELRRQSECKAYWATLNCLEGAFKPPLGGGQCNGNIECEKFIRDAESGVWEEIDKNKCLEK